MADKKKLVVTAPLVAIKDPGGRNVYLYRGAEVTDGFDKDSVEHHKSLGMVGEQTDDVVPGVGA